MSKQLQSDIVLTLVTMIWGSTFIIVKNAIQSLPVYNFLFIRFLLAFLLLAAIFYKKLKKIDKSTLMAASLIGTMLFLGYAFQTMGLLYTTASKSGFITGFSVVLVPILEAILLKRKPTKAATVGVVLAFIGLILLTTNIDLSINIGDFLTLLCAFAFAMHIVLISKYASKMDTYLLATVQIGMVALLSGIVSLIFEKPFIPTSLDVWGAIIITGVFATAFAFVAQNTMQAYTTATHTALIFSLEPVFAALAAYLIAGETMSIRAIIGGAFMLAGIILSELPEKEPEKR
ncbi:drug/metabolite transporter (DMT)-like permease [Caldanaerobacter subterraneus subsp. tengcongensis MB4]|uniref:Permeases of the drug/metabolite transporter (DMT) superfamily n=1 Tax=Caldanaerobacter subterraneus subsp. tengcongensis (strain DSM 15242 / JCM 11007 / NBRC 100824 / MB4) TaxID=273068 RepID=Q8RC13_CALS4|nr:DMT family transporter [Caldanaerobacter subterraneus]AAM23907.1 Permeases of the drug/metabolite transporter (DMT) superfamily [Caldanaerobacter subterraneus subsp. tengcongensis MB4]MCS3916585.1 drug/metabolite transporter (DMT)-like permease [Caldanaerobacter subterraneus subsp. tengcongensis MB4]